MASWQRLSERSAIDDVNALIDDFEAILVAYGCTEGGLRTRSSPPMVFADYVMRNEAGDVYSYTRGSNQMVMQIQPTGVTLHEGATQQYTVTVMDDNNQPVDTTTGTDWTLSSDNPEVLLGTIDATGLYQAPTTITVPVIVQVHCRYNAPDNSYVEAQIPVDLQPTPPA